jgi:hypothetical protein
MVLYANRKPEMTIFFLREKGLTKAKGLHGEDFVP